MFHFSLMIKFHFLMLDQRIFRLSNKRYHSCLRRSTRDRLQYSCFTCKLLRECNGVLSKLPVVAKRNQTHVSMVRRGKKYNYVLIGVSNMLRCRKSIFFHFSDCGEGTDLVCSLLAKKQCTYNVNPFSL